MVILKTADISLCASWHTKANEALKHTFEPPTDNYAGEPLYNGNKEIIGIRPVFDGEFYIFPLMDNEELFLNAGVVTQEEINEYGHDNT